jgi:pimeloyl-ACP methyl ester carboxylesterase
MHPVLFPDDVQFWFETLRTFGHIAYGGADFGEVATTSQRITTGDYDSWHDEWLATADKVAAEAGSAQAAGHPISARDAFLRASNYYRMAEFFLHGNGSDPRIRRAHALSVTCFRSAAALLTPAVLPVEIPYEGTTLPGYLYRIDDSGAARPTVIMFNGFDGSVEEMHFQGAVAAVERGYTVLSFDGPGQPGTRHTEGLMFRPDWEHVVSPVIDFALTHAEVDPTRVALLGNSMGGLLAPRAAAFDDRIAAVIALDGVYDLGDISTSSLPFDRAESERRLRAPEDPELDAVLEKVMAAEPMVRWAIRHGMYAMGSATPREFCAAYLDYTLAGGIAEKVTCPTLVCSAADDGFFHGQPEKLYDHLVCPKTLLHLTDDDGAAAHCHAGGQRLAFARIYDWLDDTFATA